MAEGSSRYLAVNTICPLRGAYCGSAGRGWRAVFRGLSRGLREVGASRRAPDIAVPPPGRR